MLAYIRILAGWLGVLGFTTIIALPAYSQNEPFSRNNPSPNRTLLNDPIERINPGVQNRYGTNRSYPYGSRVRSSGSITTPQGEVVFPNVTIRNGDGSTTYYYSNGTRVTIDKTRVPATGEFLR
ncbi:hypothetical protein H6F98_26360 [Microcoleus sp. FACHB-SPT15]|uniref:hypothetical protein n=1 Tax=Microcoleus sp. FACHB-SPT15 TaxID=2692830 RepID=UPI0017830283|nr:hypothetical protein [Microcoleus sp. FACHB-SPT15]MBD1808951.1 hypothetical protein [Microcoleus sp. FACHB-SPT15]